MAQDQGNRLGFTEIEEDKNVRSQYDRAALSDAVTERMKESAATTTRFPLQVYERERGALPGLPAVALMVAIPLLAAYLFFSVLTLGPAALLGGAALIVVWFFLMNGFFVVEPNGSKVLTLFGKYAGTVKHNGFFLTNPFVSKRSLTLRARTLNGDRLKVNDAVGNPIEIAAIIVWRIRDTYRACFEVDDYEQFVRLQSETAVRHLASSHPYDAEDEAISLRRNADEISHALRNELEERLARAGVEVLEARLSHLAYAPEIASVMLRRQQAAAIIAARTRIVDGAVSMVEMALHRLEEKETVKMDDDQKARLASNLLVVLWRRDQRATGRERYRRAVNRPAHQKERIMTSAATAHRGLVIARGGAAASQPLAVSAGIATLAKGGNCIDAALAMSAVLCVVEPHNSHLGGDAFAIYYSAKNRETVAFNASGAAPRPATLESYQGGIPLHGVRAATVPGLVHCWGELHKRYGSKRFSELLQPAIDYATDGYPVGPRVARVCAEAEMLFAQNPSLKALGLSAGIAVGTNVRQPELAKTLGQIAQHGPQTFYRGAIAERIVANSAGHFTREDLATHQTRVSPPLRVRYRDLTVHGQPPPSQGHILMQELQIVGGFDLSAMDEPTRTHLMIEAKKLAFADRNAHLADPEAMTIPMDALLSPEYAAKRQALVDLDRAATDYPAGDPNAQGSDTTYFLVADRDGNAISFIQSVYHTFGSAYMIPGTGILLNNRLTGFVLDPASPNVVAPGKRPAHTLNAWLATHEDGTLAHIGGTPGGHIQVQTNLQLISHLVDGGDNPQVAIERPRWQHMTLAGAVSEPLGPGVVEIESRVGDTLLADLRARGHGVQPIGEWAHGSSAQLLSVLPNGAYALGSDPRCDGHAAGQ